MDEAEDEAEVGVKERTGRLADERLTVVGIGASAGGLKALQSFFESLSADSGIAFVVITHMAPDQESLLPELLQRFTEMPVRQVRELLAVEPNHVYVIPPGCRILMTDTHIDAEPFEAPRGQRTPVDDFFRSLAAAHRNAAAVILSGGGTDGAVGVKAIKEHGGLLLVQHPKEAESEGMPTAAIATGLADLVLPAAELAQMLVAFSRRGFESPPDAQHLSDENLMLLQRIVTQAQIQTGHELSQYQRGTLLKRIFRRMHLHSIETLEDYLPFLRNNEEEGHMLFNDLLTGVTTFFRYPKTWEALAEQVIPRLFAEKGSGEAIRVWSIGCATGEEAYSLAMLLFEEAARQAPDESDGYFPFANGMQIQVFASDLDDSALRCARQGRYPEVIEADLGQERLARFFEKEGSYYSIRREVRDAVLFTSHSVLYDPPFSRLDLISSRNLLTHLQRPARRTVMEIFFYALNPGGYLFLDGLDSVEVSPDLFKTLDQGNHIYAAQSWGEKPVPAPAMLYLPAWPAIHHQPADEWSNSAAEEQHREALEALAPPSVLVDEDFQVIHLSESAGRYLQLPPSVIKSDLLQLARPELKGELEAGVPLALQKKKAVLTRPVTVQFDGFHHQVLIAVRPFQKDNLRQAVTLEESLALVFFLEDEVVIESRILAPDVAPAVYLEQEVDRLQARLRDTVNKYETKNEQLRAANEKLGSMIAEHSVTVEELETGREELYSVNEELYATNEELDQKVEELSAANSDLENLITATDIPTLFLDRNLVIERFTPAAGRLFSLQQNDRGRPLSHLATILSYEEMMEDARRVVESLVPREREAKTVEGRWMLVRHHPYLSAEKRVEGVVLTFVDITKIKETEAELRRNEAIIAQEVDVLRRLHQMTGEVVTATEMQDALNEILDASMDLLQADFGNIQLLDRARGTLSIVAASGFERPFLERFREVDEGEDSACGRALRFGRREIIEDVTADRDYEPYLETAEEAGYRAVQSTPLINYQGNVIGVLSTHFREPRRFSERDEQWLDLLAYQAANLIERLRAEERLEQRVRHRTAQVRRLASELISAEQTVRQRLAQTLHDNLQQTLYAAKVQLQFLHQEVGEEEELARLDTMVTQSLKLTRQLTVELSPQILAEEGLKEALNWLAEHMKEHYGLQVTVQTSGHPGTANEEQRILLYQMIRELLFNIVKHAGVQEATVWLEADDGGLVITVGDQGKGFDVESVMARAGAGFGLRSIDERLRLFDGRAEIESQPGRGTQVRLLLPSKRNN